MSKEDLITKFGTKNLPKYIAKDFFERGQYTQDYQGSQKLIEANRKGSLYI